MEYMTMKTNIFGGLATHESFELPVKSGCDYIRKNGKPIKRNRASTQYLADRMAAKQSPKGFWTGIVADCGTHFRINIAGK